ncbi:phage baseplate assembly protein V, partial [Turicimonas muris]|uniref:phage baseplate assembly protein V n=3 Tax=cellular organisms TaxID=131567 RepID=UPI002601EA66
IGERGSTNSKNIEFCNIPFFITMNLTKCIQDMLARGVVTFSDGKTKMREVQCEFLAGEIRSELEHVEPYGFTSEPKTDGSAESFAAFFDGNRSNGVVLCIADRRYRITNMQAGEVAIYDDQGQKVYLKRDEILIETPKNLTATVGGKTVLTSVGNVDITAPKINIHGALIVDGAITGKGGLAISGGAGASVDGSLTTTGDVVAGSVSLDNHTHNGGPKPD